MIAPGWEIRLTGVGGTPDKAADERIDMRRIVLLAVAAALLVPPALAQSSFPETIPLPNGFRPEGIAIGKGTHFYTGSIPTGAIYAGDLRTGTGTVIIPGAAGRGATGMEVDHDRLWVSGAGTGKAFVYDLDTATLVREYQLAPPMTPTFVNDVVVTNKAAYFTDSMRDVIYRIAVGKKGEPGEATTIQLGGDYQHLPGFNLNGIDATVSGKTLFAVQTANGRLYSIDPETGVARTVDLGGLVLTNGDGILLLGLTLYVVQNQLNQIAELRLAPDLASGSLRRTITDSDFDVPTTIGMFGGWLYAVNARFSTPPTPETTYAVVQVKR
jgi:outer membrane protein assembly factor BamB